MVKHIASLLLLVGTLAWAAEKDLFQDLNLSAALEQGRQQGLPVLVNFHADWCHFCHKMDQETFTDAAVQTALRGFIAIKVDVETPEGLKLARELGVTALPTIVAFDSEGNPVYGRSGFHSPTQFLQVLQEIRK